MNCPVDGATLVMSDRQGVEIDYCPQCRGVWLDRGELDKIIDRSAQSAAPQSRDGRDSRGYDERRDYDKRGYDNRGYDSRHGSKPKRKESFLGDLFDFG